MRSLSALIRLMAVAMLSVSLYATTATSATFANGPVEADCKLLLETERLMVALVFGQSNSANFGLTRKQSGHGVYSFYQGKCFRATDPLAGANGEGGSIWTRLGDMVVASGLYDQVLFVPIGYGATMVSDWAPGGWVHYRLADGLRGPHAMGFEFTHLLWMQGEHDAINNTSPEKYIEDFNKMLSAIRSSRVKAPLLVSLTTLCGPYESDDLRDAQLQLVADHDRVFNGPDTDALRNKYRFDGCHFNDLGLRTAASAWLEAIKAIEKKPWK